MSYDLRNTTAVYFEDKQYFAQGAWVASEFTRNGKAIIRECTSKRIKSAVLALVEEKLTQQAADLSTTLRNEMKTTSMPTVTYTVTTRDVDGSTKRTYKTAKAARARFEEMLGYTIEQAIEDMCYERKVMPAWGDIKLVRGYSIFGTVVTIEMKVVDAVEVEADAACKALRAAARVVPSAEEQTAAHAAAVAAGDEIDLGKVYDAIDAKLELSGEVQAPVLAFEEKATATKKPYKVSITKSRAGHYTITLRSTVYGSNAVSEGKLSTLEKARTHESRLARDLAAHDADVAARIAAMHALTGVTKAIEPAAAPAGYTVTLSKGQWSAVSPDGAFIGSWGTQAEAEQGAQAHAASMAKLAKADAELAELDLLTPEENAQVDAYRARVQAEEWEALQRAVRMEMKAAKEKYVAIRLWGERLGSYEGYINEVQLQALRCNAPADALYERGGEWTCVRDLTADHAFRKAYAARLEKLGLDVAPAIAIDPTLPTERAKAIALEAGAAEAGVTVAVEHIEGDKFFVMRADVNSLGYCYTTEHKLCVTETDDARLLNHLCGFIDNVRRA